METETTHPSPYSTIDLGSPRPGNLDHILNPVAYFEKLDELEFRIAEIMGIDSYPRANILTESEDSESSHALKPLRTEFSLVVERGLRALRHLQSEGFCGQTFSIFVEDPVHPNTANTIHLSLDDISHSDPTEYAIRLLGRVLGDEGRK